MTREARKERMNRTIQQMARAMLDDSGTPDMFWGEAAHTTTKILNKAHVRVNSDKNPYELWYGNSPSVKHFRIFGSKCFIKNNDEKLGKFEPRSDDRDTSWLLIYKQSIQMLQ